MVVQLYTGFNPPNQKKDEHRVSKPSDVLQMDNVVGTSAPNAVTIIMINEHHERLNSKVGAGQVSSTAH